MLERKFQADLIRELEELFPGCYILKNDANYIQGFPDLLILFNDKWAALEVKAFADAQYRPNQEYHLETLNKMSYATTIYPENKKGILDMLKCHFLNYNYAIQQLSNS